jgi:hypothetical protein
MLLITDASHGLEVYRNEDSPSPVIHLLARVSSKAVSGYPLEAAARKQEQIFRRAETRSMLTRVSLVRSLKGPTG